MESSSQTPAAAGAGSAAGATTTLKPVSRFVRKPIISPEERARTNISRLLPLLIQMAALLLVIHEFEVEKLRFFRLSLVCFAGFVVHYFTPFKFKKAMFLALSLIGAFVVLNAPEGGEIRSITNIVGPLLVISVALGVGLAFYVSLRLPIPFWARLVPVLGITAVLAYLRAAGHVPVEPIWQILGALFMFRMIIYAYDVKTATKPESFMDFMNYFFLLPNFYFVLFPVIDYSTFKKSYYADDIHATAQRGVAWIARGVIHLCLYRIIYHNVIIAPDAVQDFPTLMQYIFPTFWLYLQVSGQFHIAVGMLHLFGWKLPETNHLYFLASSFTDYWRRINIYWKDFMVKVVYYPVYFRFRKLHEIAALTIATLTVFIVTTVLHAYQTFWIKGGFEVRSTEYVFWSVLGVFVLVNVIWEAKRKSKPPGSTTLRFIATALSTLAIYVVISVLWSLWYANSPGDWLETVTYWR